MSHVDRQRANAYQKEWRAKNADKVKSTKAAWNARNPRFAGANNCRCRARRDGLDCDFEYLLGMPCPELCPAIGTPISFQTSSGRRPLENVASFDRIDNRYGYVRGNVQIISLLANTAKSQMTPAQLRSFASWAMS